MEADYDIEIGNITEELHDLRRQLEQERQDHREHIAYLQKIAAQQLQQAHLRSGWPSAWELWVCRPDRNQDWRRYGLYETHAQAAATLKRVEGPPLELKIVPLYSAGTEGLPSNVEFSGRSAADAIERLGIALRIKTEEHQCCTEDLLALRKNEQDGWKEAAIAWEVCASIHNKWAKGKDALYSTRHADFVKHADDARQKLTHNALAQGREHSERPTGAEG